MSITFSQAPGYDRLGKITCMARSGGYVMVRRPRCSPFVLTEKDWNRLPKSEDEAKQLGLLAGEKPKNKEPKA